MSKTITIRLTDEEYSQIASTAKAEHRPISNYITHAVLNTIANSFYADNMEMAQIKSDEELMHRLHRGHTQARAKKGKFVE